MNGTPFFDVLKCTMSLPAPNCEAEGFRCEALPETAVSAISAKPGGSGKRKRNAATAAIEDDHISLAPDTVTIPGKGWGGHK